MNSEPIAAQGPVDGTVRPDWVKCVGFGNGVHVDGIRTWCGGKEAAFFQDPTHAALNGLQGGRLVACPECVKAICVALRNGGYGLTQR